MTEGLNILSPVSQCKSDSVLREACLECVDQCLEIIQLLPVETYQSSASGGSSIGTHMRHIIERIVCVLDGQEQGRVDYDHRARDPLLESDPTIAASTLATMQLRLEDLKPESAVTIEVRESVQPDNPAVVVISTLDRELMSLISHTIHHLAIIALLSRGAGYPLRVEIGKAPSTLLYERNST